MSVKGLSDAEIRSRIVATFSTLVADLDADQMSDYLIEGLAITIVQWQEILHKQLTKQGRCRELLNLLLMTKNPKAARVFLNALERNSQWHWILDLLSRNAIRKEAEGNESEDNRFNSGKSLEEARLDWEKEKKELLEKQRKLEKEKEELQELVDELRDMCDVDGNIDDLSTNIARAPNTETTSFARMSCRSRISLGRSYVSGKVHLKVVYNSSLQELIVTVVDCKGLARKNRRCDPYVKLYVMPDEAKITKRKTAVKYNTLNPVYKETFSYPLSISDVVTYTLWVSVWQKFRLRPNKLLGEVVIPLEEDLFRSEIDESYYLEKKLR